jgi:hypothetical protein
MSKISKVLSANDTAETGAHQAGILIPKREEILNFFPKLESAKRNPRCHILFKDASGDPWEFAYIYYNNKLFGGTRNEYRLTRMTKFIRRCNLVSGDTLFLECRDGNYSIEFSRKEAPQTVAGVLVLGTAWRIINV